MAFDWLIDNIRSFDRLSSQHRSQIESEFALHLTLLFLFDDVTLPRFITVFKLRGETGGKSLTKRSQEGRLVRLYPGPASLWTDVSWRMCESTGKGLKGAAVEDTFTLTLLSCFVDAISANSGFSYLILFSLVLQNM